MEMIGAASSSTAPVRDNGSGYDDGYGYDEDVEQRDNEDSCCHTQKEGARMQTGLPREPFTGDEGVRTGIGHTLWVPRTQTERTTMNGHLLGVLSTQAARMRR